MNDFAERVRELVMEIGVGEVVSYGDLAAGAGRPGAARAAANVLARTTGLPWWRGVASTGRLAPGKEDVQARLLRDEGVVVRGDRVVMNR